MTTDDRHDDTDDEADEADEAELKTAKNCRIETVSRGTLSIQVQEEDRWDFQDS